MITPELKKLKNRLKEVANEYGKFTVELQITVYGQAVCFNCICRSIQNSELVYTVAGTEETIEDNLRNELKDFDTDLAGRRIMDRFFPKVQEDLDQIGIR